MTTLAENLDRLADHLAHFIATDTVLSPSWRNAALRIGRSCHTWSARLVLWDECRYLAGLYLAGRDIEWCDGTVTRSPIKRHLSRATVR